MSILKDFLINRKEKKALNARKADKDYSFIVNEAVNALKLKSFLINCSIPENKMSERIMYISYNKIPKFKNSVVFCDSSFIEKYGDKLSKDKVLFIVSNTEVKGFYGIVVSELDNAYYCVNSLYRDKFKTRYIAVTGSVGKTTNTQMLYQTFSSFAKENSIKRGCITTANNTVIPICEGFNSLNTKTPFAIQECAEASPGFPEIVSGIIKPYIIVFTNIEAVHEDCFNSFDELINNVISLSKHIDKNGYVIINADDKYLSSADFGAKRITVSIQKNDTDYYAENISTDGIFTEFDIIRKSDGNKLHIRLRVPGIHNVYNAMTTVAVSEIMNVPRNIYIKALENYKASGIRQNMIKYRGGYIFADCFNASYRATFGAVDSFDKLKIKPSTKKIAILGFEEGITDAMPLAERIKDSSIKTVITFGDVAKMIYDDSFKIGQAAYHAETFEELINLVKGQYTKGDSVLVKGNRALELDRVLKSLFPKVYYKTRISSTINLFKS